MEVNIRVQLTSEQVTTSTRAAGDAKEEKDFGTAKTSIIHKTKLTTFYFNLQYTLQS